MEVALLTVGDEVLAGDTPNTNATWLANRVTERGATVARILTIPDDRTLVAETVTDWREAFDAVIVTGGLGGTHDDVTAAAIADALGGDLIVDPAVREDVVETIADYRDVDPAAIDATSVDLEIDAWAALPADSRPLVNPAGLSPGFVLENVYAFPGVPAEMRALFEQVAAEFDGETVVATVHTSWPEASLIDPIDAVRAQFDVTVGSYPDVEGSNRIKVSGEDPDAVDAAIVRLRDEIPVVEPEE